MESSLYPGDFILVNKVSYGGLIPTKPKDVPFFEVIASFLGKYDWSQKTLLSYHRMPAWGSINHSDIVVVTNPLEKGYLIKRCIGLPGDTLMIHHNKLIINGKIQKETIHARYSYKVIPKFDKLTIDSLYKYGLKSLDLLWYEGDTLHASMSITEAKSVIADKNVDTLYMDDYPIRVAGPPLLGTPATRYTRENFGPIVIPAKGMTVFLDNISLTIYKDIIVRYENISIDIRNGHLFIDNVETNQYTFKKNYYFIMGDNRYHSIDSRYWGFIPESMVVGKTNYILCSINSYEKGIKRIRFSRFFHKINRK